MEFESFGKITRYENVTVTITEKIDGTNGCIVFDEDGTLLGVQSRKRIITPGKATDNFGFAGWVADNATDLFKFFGPGRHYGEWFGSGIQRGYGMDDKWFAPFNTHRFNDELENWPENVCPTPVLNVASIAHMNALVANSLNFLKQDGSQLHPAVEFGNPEGIMVYMSNVGYLKVPFESGHKGENR